MKKAKFKQPGRLCRAAKRTCGPKVRFCNTLCIMIRIIVKETNDVMMAELLEPEKGKHHPVRNQLGLVPDDNKVKKAVEEVFKRHGVEVP